MTKEKARLRAKARAGQKTKKHNDTSTVTDQHNNPQHFGPEYGSHKGPGIHASTRNMTGPKQGSARSK